MVLCVNLSRLCWCFSYDNGDVTYLNLENGTLCSEEEKEDLCREEIYNQTDFVLIEKEDQPYKAERAFLLSLNNKNISNKIRNKEGYDFFLLFHALKNEYHLTEEWNKFQEQYYMDIAEKWCLKNGIKYTKKQGLKDFSEHCNLQI